MIYWIQGQATQLVKIGKADNIMCRLRQLQASSPDKLTVLAVILNDDDDCFYHHEFYASWSHGEWFKPSTKLMAFIRRISPSEFDGLCVTTRNLRAVRRVDPARQGVRDELANELARSGDHDQAAVVRAGDAEDFVDRTMRL